MAPISVTVKAKTLSNPSELYMAWPLCTLTPPSTRLHQHPQCLSSARVTPAPEPCTGIPLPGILLGQISLSLSPLLLQQIHSGTCVSERHHSWPLYQPLQTPTPGLTFPIHLPALFFDLARKLHVLLTLFIFCLP